MAGPSRTVSISVWDTSANAPKTGDAANLALYVIRDGVATVASKTPAEISSTHAPGEYSLELEYSEWFGCRDLAVVGTSSTAAIVVVPLKLQQDPVQQVILSGDSQWDESARRETWTDADGNTVAYADYTRDSPAQDDYTRQVTRV